MGRRIVWAFLLLLLGLTGAIGVHNGVTEWGDAHSGAQRSVTAAVLLYGIAGLIAALGLAFRKRWSVRAAVVWGIATTYAGTVAGVVYGGEDAFSVGVLAAGVACMLIAAATIWGVRAATRDQRPTIASPQVGTG